MYIDKDVIRQWYKPEVRTKYAAELEQAQNPSAETLYTLYQMHYSGAVDGSSNKKALEYCTKAAELGYAAAQYDLALHYFYGDIVEKDTYTALLWMEKSGEQLYFEACRKLASIYLGNTTVPRNIARSEYWKMRGQGITSDEIPEAIELKKWMLDEPKKVEPLEELTGTIGEQFHNVPQEYVIEADVNKSFIVNAGPGTGKTYSLIRRINYLVNQGIDADDIVVLSFTNAVVKEIKIRLNALSKTEGDRSIRNTFVKTFHSLAWWLMNKANEAVKDEGNSLDWKAADVSFNKMNYEDGLIKACELVEKNPECVSTWKCLIVDEIQDINSAKALFVLTLVKACVKFDIPVLLMGDSCQAIYNFITDDSNTANVNITAEEFYWGAIEATKTYAECVSYEKNHRQEKELIDILTPLRDAIVHEKINEYPNIYLDIKERLQHRSCAEESILTEDDVPKLIKDNPDKKICLMRRTNINTKLLSSDLIKKGINHICSNNDTVHSYPKWYAQAFGGIDDAAISKETFKKNFKKVCADEKIAESIWDKLKTITDAYSDIIEMPKVMRALRNHDLDNMINENENINVVITNVHKAKGLEYDIVLVEKELLKKASDDDANDEARVAYVALTRAKNDVFIFEANTNWFNKRNYYNRQFRSKKIKDKYQLQKIEIVSAGDKKIKDISPASFFFDEEDKMVEAQKTIGTMKNNQEVELRLNENKTYSIYTTDGHCIGVMGGSFNFFVRKMSGYGMPAKFVNIYLDGIHSFVGSSDGLIEEDERVAIGKNNRFSKNRIWNYVTFSGIADAVYEG